jgi:hypothetical protein
VRPADVGFTPEDGFVRIGSGDAGDPRRVDDRFLVPIRGASAEVRGLSNHPPTAGRVDVWVRMDRLHWFDQATGDRVGG